MSSPTDWRQPTPTMTDLCEGVRRDDIAAALDLAPNDASQYLRRLHAAGKLHRPSRGLYTPVVSVVSVVSDPSQHDTKDTNDTTLGVEA